MIFKNNVEFIFFIMSNEIKTIIENIIKLRIEVYGYSPCCLNSICEIKTGKDYRHLNKGDIPVYASGGIIAYVDSYLYDKPSILLFTSGSIQNIFYINSPFWCVAKSLYLIVDENIVRLKYLYYYLKNIQLEKLSLSRTIPTVNKSAIEKLVINIPSLEEQDKIILKLEKYNKLLNNNNKKETNLKIQYEEYRNKLLNF